jgi:hypothetical protein
MRPLTYASNGNGHDTYTTILSSLATFDPCPLSVLVKKHAHSEKNSSETCRNRWNPIRGIPGKSKSLKCPRESN